METLVFLEIKSDLLPGTCTRGTRTIPAGRVRPAAMLGGTVNSALLSAWRGCRFNAAPYTGETRREACPVGTPPAPPRQAFLGYGRTGLARLFWSARHYRVASVYGLHAAVQTIRGCGALRGALRGAQRSYTIDHERIYAISSRLPRWNGYNMAAHQGSIPSRSIWQTIRVAYAIIVVKKMWPKNPFLSVLPTFENEIVKNLFLSISSCVSNDICPFLDART